MRVKGAKPDDTLQAEQAFVKQLKAHSIKSAKFTDIIPPTRSYSSSQEAALLRKMGADSLLTVHITGKDSVETYIPPTFYPGQTTTQDEPDRKYDLYDHSNGARLHNRGIYRV